MDEFLVYEGEFCRIWQYPEDLILEIRFKPTSMYMQDEEFQDTMQKLLKVCRDTEATSILLNNEYNQHTISPGLQSWMHQEVYPRLAEMGVKRKAILPANHMFSRVSMEQTLEDNPVPSPQYQFFEKEKEAMAWLLKP